MQCFLHEQLTSQLDPSVSDALSLVSPVPAVAMDVTLRLLLAIDEVSQDTVGTYSTLSGRPLILYSKTDTCTCRY